MWFGKIEDCIIYEEKDFLVCHKPSGLAVQNARIGTMDMESALKNYLAAKNPGKIPYLAVVHRLDQPVEGVLVFAKSQKAAGKLSSQMAAGEMGKYYLAVTKGKPSEKAGVLEDYLKKDGKNNLSSVVKQGSAGAKKAILRYEVLEELEEKVLLGIKLETGRHHQIRVQLAHHGMALAGDRKYNKESENGISLGLCSEQLFFAHPMTGKKMEFHTIPTGNAFEGFAYFKR